MKTDKEYLTFLRDLKQSILKSRYIAMRLANREQLILYYSTGLKLSKKVAEEKWGAKVIQQLADDLQNELPGLKGFSRRNLMKMKQFYEAYATFSIVPLTTAQLNEIPETIFYSVSFSHHMVLLNKCKNLEERLFYMSEAATQFWSVIMLEYKINAALFKNSGALPNNFERTLPGQIKPTDQ